MYIISQMAWQHVGRAPSVAFVQLLLQPLRAKVIPRYHTRCYTIETSTTKPCDLQLARLREICKDLRNSSVFEKTAIDLGVDDNLYPRLLKSFCKMIRSPKKVVRHSSLASTVREIHEGREEVERLFPYFVEHAKQLDPLVFAMKGLKMGSDLTDPRNWYPLVQGLERRFVLHVGPTNSGKTHHAHQAFMAADNAIYCSPLRMLAAEVYKKTNKMGVSCDLVTGEERLYGTDDHTHHVACTVEMTNINPRIPYDVAVIDEIQMLKDPERGGAWTRALLGVPAHTVHLCGEPTTVPLVKKLVDMGNGARLEIKEYKRLNPLVPLRSSLKGRYYNVNPGDCVVAFSRKKIFAVKKQIESTRGLSCAVVYGGLPAATRNQQAELFNKSKLKVIVATDAIGMGLNLNIKRIVFHSLFKFNGRHNQLLTSSQTRQIAGRAGRYGKDHAHGEVTTIMTRDIPQLHNLLNAPVEYIEKAGLSPSFEHIKTFSSYLPEFSLSKLLGVFLKTATVSDDFFLCEPAIKQQIVLSTILEGHNLSLRDSFTFSLAPVNIKNKDTLAAYKRFVGLFSSLEPTTLSHLHRLLSWPLPPRISHAQLTDYEGCHEILDLYLWLSQRFEDLFPDHEDARMMQREVEKVIGRSLFVEKRK